MGKIELDVDSITKAQHADRESPETKCVTNLTPQEITSVICKHFGGEDELFNHSNKDVNRLYPLEKEKKHLQ